eukprot:scaffold41379_cov71-Phaeocystis_antarctica.AAC.10
MVVADGNYFVIEEGPGVPEQQVRKMGNLAASVPVSNFTPRTARHNPFCVLPLVDHVAQRR